MREVSPSLQAYSQLDDWIRIETDGSVTVFTGKVELGQGLKTAVARIAAEELDLALERIRVHTADTAEGPNEGVTAGSLSLEHSGTAIRTAAAEARQFLIEAAAERLGVHADQLRIEDGTVCGPQRQKISYAELLGGGRFDHVISGSVPAKEPASYQLIGRPGPRVDLFEKVTGGGAFLHDLRLPRMVFARVVRPPGFGWRLARVDTLPAEALPGVVAVVREGSFLGVIAEREDQAERAQRQLQDATEWDPPETPVSVPSPIGPWLAEQPAWEHLVIAGVPEERAPGLWNAPAGAAFTHRAMYARPFLLHGAMGPSAAVALEEHGRLTIWTHSQSVSITRDAIAHALERSPPTVRLIHRDGPGCYGHNGADDAALDAAFLAQAVPGRPVMLQWTREDENRWEPYGPAMRVDLCASLDDSGSVIGWNHEVTSFNQLSRAFPPHRSAQLSTTWLRQEASKRPDPIPLMLPEIGEYRNATPYYDFPESRIVRRMIRTQPLRTSSIRGLGAFANVFAIESFMDELASRAHMDALSFRLTHLKEERARAVLRAAADRADWSEAAPLGLAFARYENCRAYVAIVVELEVEGGDTIRLRRAVIAADAGQIVDPMGLTNQLEGGFIQAASWTLREAVRFEAGRLLSTDWESYPILGFSDIPEIETVLLDRPGDPILGAGEATQGPTPAAIANAVFRVTGKRLRETPFTPERIRNAKPR